MRGFVLLFTILASILALSWSAAVGQAENENAAESLLDVDSGVDHSKEVVRQARQFGFGGFGRPYGGYGGYGGYGRPYGGYGGYGGFGRPYGGYGGYGGFGRPYGGYGGYGGFPGGFYG